MTVVTTVPARGSDPAALPALTGPVELERYSMDDWLSWLSSFSYQGTTYAPGSWSQTLTSDCEPAPRDFVSQVRQAYSGNAVVFALMAIRALVFSSARFTWQRMSNGRPSQTFGSQALRVLEVPWPGATTQDLLLRMMTHADIAGNAFGILDTSLATLGAGDPAQEVVLLRPDWVNVLHEPRVVSRVGGPGRSGVVGKRLLGIAYTEGGPLSGSDPVVFYPGEYFHYAPLPDPTASWRGMSWLTPVVREMQADTMMTDHKRRFFENGATPSVIVKYPPTAQLPDVEKLMALFADRYGGLQNAYKAMHIGGGADVTVVGSNLQQIDFRAVQGAGETRLAAAAGVPPVVAGLSESLAGSSLNVGNYQAARRRFADGTMHPLWQNAAGSLGALVRPEGPNNSNVRLWYDVGSVPFLADDVLEAANRRASEAQTIRTLSDGGFTPESVVASVLANDWQLLQHTGLLPVQVQAPGSGSPSPDNAPAPAADGGTQP